MQVVRAFWLVSSIRDAIFVIDDCNPEYGIFGAIHRSLQPIVVRVSRLAVIYPSAMYPGRNENEPHYRVRRRIIEIVFPSVTARNCKLSRHRAWSDSSTR